MLGCDNLNDFDVEEAFTIPTDELYRHFDINQQLFGSMALPLPARPRGMDEIVLESTVLESEEKPVDQYEM